MRREWYAGIDAESALDENERRELKRFEMLCRNFARLERCVTGNIHFELPSDTLARVPALEGSAVGQGAELADLERKRLRLGEDPLDDLAGILDQMGLKVFGVRMPDTSRVAGGFFFDSDVGPCIVVNSSFSVEEQMMSAAHQYCHFLADYSPYLPRVCYCGGPTGEDACEERAAGFAGAFLVPAGSLEKLLTGSDPVGTTPEALEALGVYYGVPLWAVGHRLRSLGIDVDPVDEEGCFSHEMEGAISADLPRRMIKLALEARTAGLVSPMRMARLLQMTPQNSENLFSYYLGGLEREREMDTAAD